jgi:predicted PurR-regulated permease PerM
MTVFSLFRPLAWAILLAFISYPAYRTLVEIIGERHKNLAAMLLTFLMVVLLVAPTLMIGIVTSREGIGLFGKLADLLVNVDPSKGFSLDALLPEVVDKKLLPLFEQYPLLKDGTQQLVNWLTYTTLALSRNFLGNLLTLLYRQIIIFIAFYFLLRDGHVLLDYFKDIIPLMDEEEREEFTSRAGVVLRSVVFGVFATAGVQGVLGAAGWWFVGLPGPLLAGVLMALLAMIPFIGMPTLWIPGAAYLFLIGNVKDAVILVLWSLCVVGTVDSFLRPYFISEKAKMSAFLVLVGAFGGLSAWGFLGLFMGPLILSLFVFSLDSYRKVWMFYQSDSVSPEAAPPNSSV